MAPITVRASDLAIQVETEPTQLATRTAGKRFLTALKGQLKEAGRDQVVILDFSGVNMMDASFPDEVFGTLGAERAKRKFAGASLVLSHLSESLIDSLNVVLQSRPRREPRLGNCVIPMLGDDGRLHLIGPSESHVQDTFDLLKQHKSITARDLKERYKLEIGAASTRLKTVYDLGLAIRSAERDASSKQYTYFLPV